MPEVVHNDTCKNAHAFYVHLDFYRFQNTLLYPLAHLSIIIFVLKMSIPRDGKF